MNLFNRTQSNEPCFFYSELFFKTRLVMKRTSTKCKQAVLTRSRSRCGGTVFRTSLGHCQTHDVIKLYQKL
jgi:hypothetical protein